MESQSLKVLFVGSDERFARDIADAMAKTGGTIEAVGFDAALSALWKSPFHAVLFEPAVPNTAALFQITSLAVRSPGVPVIVLGSADNEAFAVEVIAAGAQDYLDRKELDAHKLERTIRCAMERQVERTALISEKENYYSIFDHLVEGIFRTTTGGYYLLVNTALARIYGYDSPVELMASITDIAHRLYVEPGRRDEFVRLMQERDTLHGFESKIYRKNGDIIWISENCRAVRDAQGKVLYYEGTVEDITRQRQMEEALQRSESLYHSLVETMPQGVFRRDLQGRFTFANQPYCKFHKKTPEEIIGKTDYDFFPKAAADKFWRDDLRIMEEGLTMDLLEEAQPVGMTEKEYHHVIKTPLRDEAGRVIGLQGMIWDVTEKIRAEEKIRLTTAELARSREELRGKNQMMEENLRVAADIQIAMLPQQYPVFPASAAPEQSAFQFVHRYEPAESVSGDFFSVSALSDTEAGVLICDVTGHGVRAALVTAMIRALAEELKPFAREPGNFLRKLNSDLGSILKNTGTPMLTTAFYAVADCRAGTLRFANAGHPKPLVIRRSTGHVEPLANNSGRSQPALGLFEDPPYATSETVLVPGDFLMLFTDGLYEVLGQNEEIYSQERLVLDVKNLLHQPSGVLFDELITVIRTFALNGEFDDDVCLVGMDYLGIPAVKS